MLSRYQVRRIGAWFANCVVQAAEAIDTAQLDEIVRAAASCGHLAQRDPQWHSASESCTIEVVLPDSSAFSDYLAQGIVRGSSINCRFKDSPFDTNGVLYHIATAGGTREYLNPHNSGEVRHKFIRTDLIDYLQVEVTISNVFEGGPDLFVQNRPEKVANCTANEAGSWMAVDLRHRSLIPSHYALRHGNNKGKFVPRSWLLQGSIDGEEWICLRRHENDASLAARGFSEAAWPIDAGPQGYGHFRVFQPKKDHLVCGGIELYGELRENPI